MKLAISEEKINIEAAALEICRNEIMFDLEAELKFSIEPIECYKLQTMLEDYLLDRNYMSIREKIVSNMTSAEQTQIPDYKVEMYLRNFIIEPLLEDNYQRLLATLRLVINEQFIPQFPITTTVLEDSIVQTFNLRRNDLLPVQAMYSTIETFLPVLNIATNFDSLCSAISREVNYFEHLVHSVPQQIDILSRLTQESIMIVKTLEFNCWILLDLCCKVLNTVINNYRLDILLTVDEIAKLRLDFKDYSRQRIVQDKRYLNKLSPNSLNNSINGYCKEAWSRIRKKITNDLAVREKNKVNLPFSERAMFKHSFFKHFKDDAEIIMTQKIGIVPREDVFLYNNYQKVSQNIDTMIDDCFHQMVISMKDTSEALKVQIQDMLTNIYQPSTILRYKWFQLTPKFNLNEVLSLVNRKTIVLCALVATPKTYFVDEYRSHLDHIAHIAADLEVLNEPEIKDMFKIVDNFESRKKNKAFLNAQVKKNEQTFKSNHSLKLPEITYLILGLYFLVTDAGKDIEEMRRAFENNDIIRLSHPCYTKRRLLFQIIRSLKNGQFFLLNYSLVHMIELFLDRQRMTHNRYMSEKVWKKNISDIYVTEYNDVIKRYKEMKTAKLVALVEQVDNGLNDPQRAKRDLLFKSNFISDTKFNDQDLVINSDKTPMLCVNKSRTIETITESTMRGPHNLSRNLSRNSSRLSTDSGIGSPLLNCSIMSGMSEKEIEEDQDLKFHGKLQYLQENIRTYEFIPLQKEKNARSRYPIMVLSGFMSENSNKLDDWKQMLELFPYTEIVTINWESLTPAQIASNFFHSFRKVSVGSISSLIAGQLHTILSKKEATIIEEADTNQQIDPNANPFERGLQEQELEDSGVPRENTEEATTGGIFGLLKMAKFKDIFNTKNLTLVSSILT